MKNVKNRVFNFLNQKRKKNNFFLHLWCFVV